VNIFKHTHLWVSAIIIAIVGLAYGVCPQKVMPWLFHFEAETANLKHVFRALMGLYLSMAVFWIVGACKPEFWVAATLSNSVFFGGLALGRILGLILDQWPAPLFLLGLVLEIILCLWGICQVRNETNFR
jgi:Domain of unknown function (DUF4345)